MEREKYGAPSRDQPLLDPFPRYTTSGQPDVFRVIVPPCSAHAAWIDVVGHHVAIIGELSITECAFAVLGNNLPVEELPHLSVGSEFPVSSGVMRIFNAPNAHLALALFSWDLLSSAAEVGTVNRAELIPAESHGVHLIGFGVMVRLG